MRFNPQAILRYCGLLNTYAWILVILWTISFACAGFVLGKAYGVSLVMLFRNSRLPSDEAQFVGNMTGLIGVFVIGALGYFLGELAAILWRATSYGLVTLIEIERNTRAPANRQQRERE